MTEEKAILVLADGTTYHGQSIGAAGSSVGELVFNTAMTGYQEMLTDPSYAQQLITLTTAHVGNTGCNLEDMESSKIWAAGLIVREYSPTPFHYRQRQSLSEFLKKNKVVAIAGLDTRALTLKIRQEGALSACLTTEIDRVDAAIEQARAFAGLQNVDLAKAVSTKTTESWSEGQGMWATAKASPSCHVVVYDFGVKHSILRILHDKGCRITVVPAETSAKEVMALQPDGVVLSNGPGDPKACDYAIVATETFLSNNLPVLGICLGFQILALATGAITKKMPFGHHGANHPVLNLQNKRVFISSQNHGFAVDEASLPAEVEVTHKSLFDGSLQGIAHKTKKAFGFQGHPEASPGPHDLDGLFDNFIRLIQGQESIQ